MNKIFLTITLLLASVLAYGLPKFKSFEKVVATAGTRVALSASKLSTTHAVIKAKATNTGLVYVGGDDVAAANGFHLAANQEVPLDDLMQMGANESYNLADVWIDSAVNGEGVRILYVYDRYKP